MVLEERKSILSKVDPIQKIGMALVKNVPSQITKSEICQVCSHFYNVVSVLSFNASDLNLINSDGFCWIGVISPEDTLNELSNITIAGAKLQIQLMGYLYPDQG